MIPATYARKVGRIRIQTHQRIFFSHSLGRNVIVQFYYPKIRGFNPSAVPCLLFNDGQLLESMDIKRILRKLYTRNQIKPCVLVAIHSNEKRVDELGTSKTFGFKNLGIKSESYQKFILDELLPKLSISKDLFIIGFSLGGLSAVDISINHPDIFRGVGVFSGAFWWRSEKFNVNKPDANLIIPHKISKLTKPPSSNYWFQTGSLDEMNDRNHNGIIDSIDDTKIVINSLLDNGLSQNRIAYLEKLGGRHTAETWAIMLPQFLVWASKLAQKKRSHLF